jgi:hypothetical protein
MSCTVGEDSFNVLQLCGSDPAAMQISLEESALLADGESLLDLPLEELEALVDGSDWDDIAASSSSVALDEGAAASTAVHPAFVRLADVLERSRRVAAGIPVGEYVYNRSMLRRALEPIWRWTDHAVLFLPANGVLVRRAPSAVAGNAPEWQLFCYDTNKCPSVPQRFPLPAEPPFDHRHVRSDGPGWSLTWASFLSLAESLLYGGGFFVFWWLVDLEGIERAGSNPRLAFSWCETYAAACYDTFIRDLRDLRGSPAMLSDFASTLESTACRPDCPIPERVRFAASLCRTLAAQSTQPPGSTLCLAPCLQWALNASPSVAYDHERYRNDIVLLHRHMCRQGAAGTPLVVQVGAMQNGGTIFYRDLSAVMWKNLNNRPLGAQGLRDSMWLEQSALTNGATTTKSIPYDQLLARVAARFGGRCEDVILHFEHRERASAKATLVPHTMSHTSSFLFACARTLVEDPTIYCQPDLLETVRNAIAVLEQEVNCRGHAGCCSGRLRSDLTFASQCRRTVLFSKPAQYTP